MNKRILVVEDQPDNRQIIRDMLAPTDYEITEAESGEEALEAIAKQRPDLILMDIQLPIMDGYTATRQIKADPALRSIPIIAVTVPSSSARQTFYHWVTVDIPETTRLCRLSAVFASFMAEARRVADALCGERATPVRLVKLLHEIAWL